jgi:hypothetical protein
LALRKRPGQRGKMGKTSENPELRSEILVVVKSRINYFGVQMNRVCSGNRSSPVV